MLEKKFILFANKKWEVQNSAEPSSHRFANKNSSKHWSLGVSPLGSVLVA